MEFLDFSSEQACNEYERFVQQHPTGCFTQSVDWVKVKTGWKPEVILVRDDQHTITASMLILIKSVPVLGYALLYSARGPVCDYQNMAVLRELKTGIDELARRYHAYLCKCDPPMLASDASGIQAFTALGFVQRSDLGERTIQCRNNYMLTIEGRTAEEIFESFHKKWRYNIHLAERKGVVCRFFDKDTVGDHMDEFYRLMEETGHRDGFYIRSKAYFLSMLEHLGSHCRLYLCYHEGQAISGAIATQYAGKTCYVYGASTAVDRQVMPNYLMQWSMIQWAIENGDSIYDFQGIPYYYDESHPNYGVYRFKKGFNGQIVEYVGELDYVLSPSRKALVDCAYKASKALNHLRANHLHAKQ